MAPAYFSSSLLTTTGGSPSCPIFETIRLDPFAGDRLPGVQTVQLEHQAHAARPPASLEGTRQSQASSARAYRGAPLGFRVDPESGMTAGQIDAKSSVRIPRENQRFLKAKPRQPKARQVVNPRGRVPRADLAGRFDHTVNSSVVIGRPRIRFCLFLRRGRSISGNREHLHSNRPVQRRLQGGSRRHRR